MSTLVIIFFFFLCNILIVYEKMLENLICRYNFYNKQILITY